VGRFSLMFLCALGVSAFADDLKITDSKLVFNGFGYFRGKAESVDLATYGEKKTPIDKTNYLAKEANVARDNLGKVKVSISGPYTINWSSYSDTDVKASISYLTAAGGTAAFSRQAADSAKLKMVLFSIDGEGPLKNLLNDYANAARTYLKDEGNDGRVTSAVWVVMEGTLAETVKKCGKVTGKGTDDGIRVSIDVKSCAGSKSTVDIPPRTTFAYGLHKVKNWDKTVVKNMEDDQPGMN
ncbi:MAG TPA: hypothetical protein VND93_08650, partial [Myxococcales bacterium]|nr:hypothetical protein [Myxococcales bacterium]